MRPTGSFERVASAPLVGPFPRRARSRRPPARLGPRLVLDHTGAGVHRRALRRAAGRRMPGSSESCATLVARVATSRSRTGACPRGAQVATMRPPPPRHPAARGRGQPRRGHHVQLPLGLPFGVGGSSSGRAPLMPAPFTSAQGVSGQASAPRSTASAAVTSSSRSAPRRATVSTRRPLARACPRSPRRSAGATGDHATFPSDRGSPPQ